jgi:hypothetical protein
MSKVPSQSTGKGGTKQPRTRTSSCHCRICHCTTPRLDALHRHPSSLNRSPRYPNLRTPLHIAPKTKIINPKYSPASLPAHSTAQLNPQNAPTPLYQMPMHTRVYYTTSPHLPEPAEPTHHSTARAQHTTHLHRTRRSCPAWARNLARTRRAEFPPPSLRHRTHKHEHEHWVQPPEEPRWPRQTARNTSSRYPR